MDQKRVLLQIPFKTFPAEKETLGKSVSCCLIENVKAIELTLSLQHASIDLIEQLHPNEGVEYKSVVHRVILGFVARFNVKQGGTSKKKS